ncbi:hypothetical protein [Hyphomonas sp.]|uniref:hypothetical protein n=1 Tax=Hyphomonas sp. TaxID=87 RepID=UPI0035689437
MGQELPLSSFHESIAKAHGLSLYGRYTEQDAASVLDFSLVSLRRLRSNGGISFVRMSPRKIAYFGYQLVDFLLQSVEEPECPDIPTTGNSSSGIIGSRNEVAVKPGIGHGSTPKVDKHAALASAQRILNRQRKS